MRRKGQVSGIVCGEGHRGLSEAGVFVAWVFGALVWAGDGGDDVHFAGVIGDGCAGCGEGGEGASLVGRLIFADHFDVGGFDVLGCGLRDVWIDVVAGDAMHGWIDG